MAKMIRLHSGFVVAFLTLSLIPCMAFAYFTSNASAEGGFMLRLAPNTEIKESYGSRRKHVTISNSPDSAPVYVRAKALSSLPVSHSGDGWERHDDGWLYLRDIVNPGEEAPTLDVSIEFPTGRTETVTDVNGVTSSATIPAPSTGTEHDVTVVYETVVVGYDSSGSPLPPDECWNMTHKDGE